MISIKPTKNKRSRKLVHKQYRRYGDIWGRLALKKRDNFITTLVYRLESQSFNRKKRKMPHKMKRSVRKKFKVKGQTFTPFAFEINTTVKQVRRRRQSRRGNLLKLRRAASLYYGGGRIRKKTFRRYGKQTSEKARFFFDHLKNENSGQISTYGALVESRLDILLLRCNFVDSIYRARILILQRKAYAQSLQGVSSPALLIKTFQCFGLRGNYSIQLRRALLARVKKHAILCLPSYLFINFTLMTAFKIEHPHTERTSFPFAELPGAAAIFRKSFSYL